MRTKNGGDFAGELEGGRGGAVAGVVVHAVCYSNGTRLMSSAPSEDR